MIGTVLRIRYELVELVDDGAMFATYKALDRVGGKTVCIRVLQSPLSHEAAFVDRLRQVVQRASAIVHPSVERFVDLDEDEGVPFIVSEFSIGETLEARIKRLAPFSPSLAVSMAIGIAEALDTVHSGGFVHGDVSSRNVIVGADNLPKLQLTGLWESYSGSRRAGAIALPDMAPYLAPEITDGSMPSPSTDVYALGVLLFQLLTARDPFNGDTAVSIALKHATAPVPSVRSVNPSVPLVLDEIVKKAMAKGTSDRYPDAKAVLKDLRTLQDALRFGKTLTWPIQYPGIAPTQKPKDPAPQPIAPKMSAVRQEAKESKKRDAEEKIDSDSIPKWLSGIAYFCIIVLVLGIGGWVYFNISKPKEVIVPDILNLSLNEANAKVLNLNLRLKVSKRETSDEAPEGTVLDSNPRPGEKAREHSTIGVVVSSGSKFVTVPDLKGRTVDEAKEVLTALDLDLEEPPEIVRDRDVEEGLIVSQLPEARLKIEKGSKVRVKVSGGARGGRNTGASGSVNTYSLHIKLPSGDGPITVRVDMIDDKETKTIYEALHQAGEEIDVSGEGFGREAIFKIYFDNELVKQVTKSAGDAVGP